MSDGLLDVIIMEPFDMIDAPQISIDMFNKTLDRNARIKTFRTRHILVHRQRKDIYTMMAILLWQGLMWIYPLSIRV